MTPAGTIKFLLSAAQFEITANISKFKVLLQRSAAFFYTHTHTHIPFHIKIYNVRNPPTALRSKPLVFKNSSIYVLNTSKVVV